MDNLTLHFAPIFFHLVMFFVITEYFIASPKLVIKKSHKLIIAFCLKTALAASFIISVYMPLFHEVDGQVLWDKDKFLLIGTMVVYGSFFIFIWVLEYNRRLMESAKKNPKKKDPPDESNKPPAD